MVVVLVDADGTADVADVVRRRRLIADERSARECVRGRNDEPLGRYPWRRRWQCVSRHSYRWLDGQGCMRSSGDSHEQTGLSTGTVTNNDQLATDFRHLGDGSIAIQIWVMSGSGEVENGEWTS